MSGARQERRLTMDKRELKCPKCGAPILITDTECMNCGAELHRGRLAEEVMAAQTQAEEDVAEVIAGEVEYRTLPEATSLDWSALAGEGFGATLSRSWRFFWACMQMLVRYPLMLIPALLSIVVSIAILAAAWGVMKVTGVWDMWMQAEDNHTPWQVYAVGVPFALLSYIALLSFMGMTAHMVDVYLRGRRATLGQAFADVVKNFPALFYLAVVNVVVGLLLSLLREKSRSAVGRAAASAGERAQRLANLLLVPIIMLEDKPLREASKRAIELYRRSIVDIVIAELGLLLFNRTLGAVVAIIAAGLLVTAYLLYPSLLLVAVAGAIGLMILGAAVTSFIHTAYYTCLYLWTAAMEAMKTEDVPAPEPLAKALAA